MQIEIEVEEKGEVVRTISSNAEPHETLEGVLRRTAPQLAVDIDELLADIAVDGKVLSGQDTVAEALSQGRRLRHRRVCVELRFETETITHLFPAAGTWALVHRFGCRKFEVPHDACANLELREDSQTGPALNDKVRMGVFRGCKTVWLVKPGPEPNG